MFSSIIWTPRSKGTCGCHPNAPLIFWVSANVQSGSGEPDCTFADTQKIRGALGWQPQVPFERGVQIMLENIDYWRQAPVWNPESISTATQEWFTHLGGGARP